MKRLSITTIAAILLAAAGSRAAPQITTTPVAADVTDRSFAIVWEANEAVRGTLHLFIDENGAAPIDAANGIVSDSAGYPGAEISGTVRVRAMGLPSDTDVFYQVQTTSVANSSVTLWPASPPFPSVRLQATATISTQNDLGEVKVRAAGGTGPAPGSVVLIDVPGAAFPVTAFVGEAGTTDAAIVDLNNLFDENVGFGGFVVQGGEVASITVLGGKRGSVSTTATLAAPTGGVRLVNLLASPLTLPIAAPACSNGIDDDADTYTDVNDPGCSGITDTSERASNKICDDGVDNDGDGAIDFPFDPGCNGPGGNLEAPQCDDGIDNDGDGKIDWDGGPGGGTPDPQCTAQHWRNNESTGCGIGFELALVVPALWLVRVRRMRGTTQ